MKGKYVLGALLVVLIAALVYFNGGGQAPPGQPPLESVTAQNVASIKNRFNSAKDDVRVVLLLSPT